MRGRIRNRAGRGRADARHADDHVRRPDDRGARPRRTYAQSTYRDGDFLVFGSESSGIPEPLLAAAPERCERIPMLRDCDSLDNAETWEAHEVSLGHIEDGHEAILRQDICGNFVNPDDYRISALNLSNSAAIVLYEALRQTGFAGM